MKQKNCSPNQASARTSQTTAASNIDQDEIDCAPAPDEVARRAYFSYEKQGSLHGNHVQHWVVAEAELIAERNRNRSHGFQERS